MVTQFAKVPRSPETPINEVFDHTGWHLERTVLDDQAVTDSRIVLDERRKVLQARFEKWVGEPISESKSYSWHQSQIPEYEKKEIPEDLRHFLVGEFDVETRLDPRIREVLSTDRCRDFICGFLGTDQYYFHYPPMLRFKLPNAPGNLVPPHHDLEFNKHLSNFFVAWVPLVDIDNDCGGLIVYDGSHLDNVGHGDSQDPWKRQAVAELDKYPSQHVLMNAGDLLMYPQTFLHQSAPQRSNKYRYSIDFRVIRRPQDTIRSYYDPFKKQITRVH